MKLSRKARFLIAAVLLLVAFLSGFIPQYLKSREATAQALQAQTQLAAAQAQLRLATLQNNLGMILVEVEQNNFQTAKERSTRFFDELRQTIALTRDDGQKQRLTTLLNHRDEVTSDLTTLNAETAVKLRSLYLNFSPGATVEQPPQ